MSRLMGCGHQFTRLHFTTVAGAQQLHSATLRVIWYNYNSFNTNIILKVDSGEIQNQQNNMNVKRVLGLGNKIRKIYIHA